MNEIQELHAQMAAIKGALNLIFSTNPPLNAALLQMTQNIEGTLLGSPLPDEALEVMRSVWRDLAKQG